MKTKNLIFPLLALVLASSVLPPTAAAQPTAFAYQGRLNDAGVPAQGLYDLEFRVFDTADVDTGTQYGSTLSFPAVSVDQGNFNAVLDFGPGVFDGSARFIEIRARAFADPEPAKTLAPRQAVLPVPYALHSLTTSQSGSNGILTDPDGNVALGTGDFPAGVRLNVKGPARFDAGGIAGFLQLGTPNGESGLSSVGSNRFDLRFNGNTLTLAAGPSGGPPSPANGLTMNTNGNVAVGMGSPLSVSPWKFHINGPTRITPAGQDGSAIQFSTPNSEVGMSLFSGAKNNRADIRFDDTSLKLVTGPNGGPPSSANGITIHQSGNVGIGTTTIDPNIRLEVKTGDSIAVFGRSSFEGIHGESTHPGAAAVAGFNLSSGFGVYGESKGGGYGGFFIGRVRVGSLEIAGGADLSEPFPITEECIPKGSVVVIDERHSGQLRLSTEAYDKRVAGIVSGAHGINPGISLRQEGRLEGGENVALTGRVYVLADASDSPILPGDLLTTSATPGHAMKASDLPRAQGAILGKAMTRLEQGRGMVLVLVSLQ